MSRVTLWLTEEAALSLDRVCRRDRISQTAALQSALECVHLFRLTSEHRAAVLPHCDREGLDRAVEFAWAVATDLSHKRGVPRVKFIVPYDEDLLEALRKDRIGEGFGVSLSGAVSAVFVRWGDDETTDIRETKRCVWRWALPRAQARTDARRMREPGPPLGEGLLATSS